MLRKQKILLLIDTSNNKEVIVGVQMPGKEDIRRQIPDHRKAQVVLPLIQVLLTDNGLNLKDITAIEVNPGPGSFTGLRVGITIANTLGLLLNVPVNGNNVGEPIDAVYS